MQKVPAVGTVGLFHQATAWDSSRCANRCANLQVKYKHMEKKARGMHDLLKTLTTSEVLNDENLGVSHSSILLYLETKKAK